MGDCRKNSALFARLELIESNYFCTEDGAQAGVTYENTSETEPLVVLRYFGPDANPDAPEMGAHKKRTFA